MLGGILNSDRLVLFSFVAILVSTEEMELAKLGIEFSRQEHVHVSMNEKVCFANLLIFCCEVLFCRKAHSQFRMCPFLWKGLCPPVGRSVGVQAGWMFD